MPKKRNYKREYANQGSQPARKKARARNNKANRQAGTYGNGDGKDVAHAKAGAKGKVIGLQNPSKNRSFKRTKTAGRKRG